MYNLLAEKKTLAVSTVMALAFIMVMGPSSMAFNAFATSGNSAEQEIEQEQYVKQIGICVTNDGNLFSCNNISDQDQENNGGNAASQSSDDGGDNEAEQSIEQEQGLKQTALCASNDGNFLSCNNVGFLDQTNNGGNALAQSSYGDDGGDNEAEQSIEQEQGLKQTSISASNGYNFLSGNNVGFLDQTNNGGNALAQSSYGDDDGGDNEAEQSIEQDQYVKQVGVCVSNDGNLLSCNNLAFLDQENNGGNAASQSSGGDDGGGDNEAEQSISQEQGLKQTALCASNDGNFLSCNNIGFLDQENNGGNAASQGSYGYYGGDNELEQSISQEQGLKQTSISASNGDNFLSGNNVGFLDQTNNGGNAALQSSGGDDGGGDNEAEQSISQEQSTKQETTSVSNDDNEGSGNNISDQDQENNGGNAASQSSDDDGDNDSEQSISQEQDTEQESTSVSNDDNEGSGNNISDQEQTNNGGNAVAQD